MAISQADFYAFSQATGAPVPEDPESRARIAPQVMEWRRNQLKQPAQQEEGPNLVQTLGGLAAAAGVGTLAFLGGRRLGQALAARRGVTPVNVQVQEDIVRRAAQPVPQLRGVTQRSGAQTARPPIPRPPTQPIPVVVRDITPPSAPPRGKTGPGIVDPWSGPAPASYRGPAFESSVDTSSLLQNLQGFLGAKGRYPETDTEFQEYVAYGGRLSKALPAAEEEFTAYRPDPREMVTRRVADARRQAATEGLLQAAASRRGAYQPEIPGVKATLMELRAPAAVSAEEAGELVAQAESRPISIAPAQQNLFKYVQQAAEPQGDVVDRLLTEYNQLVERQARTDQRVRSSVREYQMELQGKALRIMDELRGDSLVEAQQTKRPFNVDQAINALESGEDQATGRIRQQLQRNEDVDLGTIDRVEDQTNNIDVAASLTPDGVPVDQAESGGRINQLVEQGKRYLRAQEVDLDYDYEPENLRQKAQVNQRIARALELKNTAERIIREEQAEAGPIDIARTRSADERRRLAAQGFAGERLEQQLLENMRANFPEGREVMAPLQEETRRIERVGMPSALSVVENIGSVEPIRQGDPERVGQPASQQAGYEGGIRGMKRSSYGISTRNPKTEEMEDLGGGIGIYGIEPKYASGAVRKRGEFGESDYGDLGYEYTEAAKRKPTDVPKWILKQEQTPFSNVSTEGLLRALEKSGKAGQLAINQELNRRQKTLESISLSETLRRANIEGRDPQEFLRRQLGGNV